MFLTILKSIAIFTVVDHLLKKLNFDGRYYFNHFICNSIVVYNTFIPMITSYHSLQEITSDSLCNTKAFIYGLHLYHILLYHNKFRFDDWLHHILMIGITLPLTDILLQTNLIANGLFFTTGLPGLIDYALLFLTRNNYIHKSIEKKINTSINVWIRAPGCITNSTLCIHYLLNNYYLISNNEIYSGIFIITSMYWNGIYFMKQTVEDLALYKYKTIINKKYF